MIKKIEKIKKKIYIIENHKESLIIGNKMGIN